MPNTDCELIAELKVVLTRHKYSPVVVGNYCAYAQGFLDYLALQNIPILDVSAEQVGDYLRVAITHFRKRYGRPPGLHWHSIPRSSIHALLRLAQGSGRPPRKLHAQPTRCGLRSATNMKLGFAKSVVLPDPASSRSCGRRDTSWPGRSDDVAPKA